MAVPVTVNYLGIGSKKHMLEVGAGVTVLSIGAGGSAFGVSSEAGATASAVAVAPTGIIGYRRQPPDGGFLLRAGLAPQMWIGPGGSAFWPAPYLSLGGTF